MRLLLSALRIAILPILFVASLPFATASCAIFETLRPTLTSAAHVLLAGLDELLTELEADNIDVPGRQQLTTEIIECFELCAESISPRHLRSFRARFHAATATAPNP